MGFFFPAPLVPGDKVVVVAPSSPFDPDVFQRGVAWLRERYDVRFDPGVLCRESYLAGDDARRALELDRAMRDPLVRAIVAARGGYGAMRILDALPWDAWAAQPSWMVGFSDITALHVEAMARGVASMHAPHVTGLGGEPDADPAQLTALRASWRAAIEAPGAAPAWRELRVVHRGGGAGVTGPIVGGNLAMLEAMAAGGRLRLPRGAILAIEDVTERPYRIDRMITALRLGGHFADLGAIVLGDFFRCDPGPDGAAFDDVIAERTRDLGIPVLAGAPFGHAEQNRAFVLGATVRVEPDALVFVAPGMG